MQCISGVDFFAARQLRSLHNFLSLLSDTNRQPFSYPPSRL